ncbi:hypothetical protein WA1_44095 [Scytonema hofmannii PCC 7110]|uniref:Outer membrane protein beta-barrel domain-containing protein n=1 Tax=Scytonema hofmannii PCC 7110 TaxID=128403 RepID=A0A139WW55_9CYAN|nr:hypothetical protein [Scytonema hofmannii]KYC36669.1 hypothetical protein WA1_44095 [Scytonema hofmannii PCC 7110]
MNTIFFRKNSFCVLSISAIVATSFSVPAVAQVVDTTNGEQLRASSGTEASARTTSIKVEHFYPNVFTSYVEKSSVPDHTVASAADLNQVQQVQNNTQQETSNNVVTPVPGTTTTSSAALVTPQETETQVKPSTSKVAQSDITTVDPGRRTRGGSSYIGIGGNIGLGGDSALSDGNFMVLSKIGLTRVLSARPSAVIGDDTAILIPVTYDLSFRSVDPFSEPLPIAPYLGAGVAIETSDDADVAFLLTGGIDVPISSQFTATAAINAAFFDDIDVGLAIGIGYNFGSLFGR